jgi:aspartyl aminopeptidase
MDLLRDDYIKFLSAINTAPEAVVEMIKRAKKAQQKRVDAGERRQPKIFTTKGPNPTKSYYKIGSDGGSVAFVRYGEYPLYHGLRIVTAHTDSPCLMFKANPERYEWDPDLASLHMGAEADVIAYGGIQPYQWVGKSVFVTGQIVHKDMSVENIIIGAGHIPDFSPHIDASVRQSSSDLNDAFPIEKLDIDFGVESKAALRKLFSMKDTADWACSRFYAVPNVVPQKLQNYFVTGWGHDDRYGLFCGLKALLSAKPKLTTILFGFDKEEVGSEGANAANGAFFENVIKELAWLENPDYWERDKRIRGVQGISKRIDDLGYRVDKILERSYLLNVDCEIGATRLNETEGDKYSIPRLAYGPIIDTQDGTMEGNQISPKVTRYLRTIAEDNNIRAQIGTSPYKADHLDGAGTMAIFFTRRGLRVGELSLPVDSLHGYESKINIGDGYWHILFTKHFFETDSDLEEDLHSAGEKA